MKRLLFLFLLFASPLLATTPDTITSSVCFQDSQANCLASGQLTLDLSQPARVTSGGGQVAPLRVSVTLDSTGKIPANTLIWGNDQLTPSGTTYHLRVFNSNGLLASDIGVVIIQGASPVDLSQLTPVSVNPTVSTNAAITTANNAFTGNNTFANINNVIFADQQAGADACAKINAAWGLAVSTGAFINGNGFQGAQSCGSNPFSAVTKTGRIEIGAAVFSTTASWTIPQGIIMRGFGRGNSVPPTYNTTAIKAIAGFPASTPVAQFGTGASGNRVEDLVIDCNNQTSAIGLQNSTGQEQAQARNLLVQNCPAIGLDIESATQNSGSYRDVEVLVSAAGCSNCGAGTIGVKINNTGSQSRGVDGVTVNFTNAGAEPAECFEFDSPGIYSNLHAEQCTTGYAIKASNVTLINPNCTSVGGTPMTSCITVAAALQNVTIINEVVAGSVTNLIANTVTGTTLTVAGEGSALEWYAMGNGGSPGECSSSANLVCTLFEKGLTIAGGGQITIQNNALLFLNTGGKISTPNLLIQNTAPTISSHFNTSGDSISANNGTAAFEVTVGTGAAGSTGAVTLPTATTSWNCTARNLNRAAVIQQTGARSTTVATFTNYGTTPGTPVNWTNSDVLSISCFAY